MGNKVYKDWKLPSFMRKRELDHYEKSGSLFYIIDEGEIVGFYTLDGKMFKNLYIAPNYREQGYATNVIKQLIKEKQVTIATTRKNCCIKKLILKLGFNYTGRNVVGKQSVLQIWESPKIS